MLGIKGLFSNDMNYLKALFVFLGASLSIVGIFVNWFEQFLPSFIINSYKYGKLSKQKHSLNIDYVPKSWFRHFYVFASVFSILASLLIVLKYFNYINGIPNEIRFALAFISGGSISKPTVYAGSAFISIILMTIHCCRRFYETQYVSVYSNSKMSIGIYFVGLLHYFGSILAIVCEAPGILANDDRLMKYDFTLRHLLAVIIFLWANKTQFDAAIILGQLRKNEKGKINSTKHYIPHGKYFELVSCPHMMSEILIYLCLWTILWGNTTWPYVVAWVVANQIECALLCHWWYQETFKNYPKERKAVIPYIL